MIHLNYKTNKELVKEMQRILPDFEFERQSVLLSSTEELHSCFSDFLSEQNTEDENHCATVTPSDVIRFLQDERVRKIVHEYRMFDPRVISMHLIYSYEMFLSSENFQRGAEDVLLPALKKIK